MILFVPGWPLVRMDSLPAPSELVEDEWAAMRIRFQREGLQYDSLTGEQRLLQV